MHHFYYTARRNGAACCTICLANPTFSTFGEQNRLDRGRIKRLGWKFSSCNWWRAANGCGNPDNSTLIEKFESWNINRRGAVSFKSCIWKNFRFSGRNLGHCACVRVSLLFSPAAPLKGDATLVRARWAQKMFKKKPVEKGIWLVPRRRARFLLSSSSSTVAALFSRSHECCSRSLILHHLQLMNSK